MSTRRTSGWAIGGTALAAVVMVMLGVWQILVGIAAISKDEIFVANDGYLYSFDLTAWGWIHVIVGALVVVGGAFVAVGRSWARWFAVGLAIVSATTQFFWMPYQPLWSLVIIALDVFVIWALISVDASAADAADAAERRADGSAWTASDTQPYTQTQVNPSRPAPAAYERPAKPEGASASRTAPRADDPS